MNIPKISVVASAYNSERYIARTIESIINQTFRDFEFILIDDASKDRTWEIITTYADQDRRIIALRNEVNLGVVGGLNRGLEVSRGEYIARQDADDISLSERFARQAKFLDEHPEYGVVGSRVRFIDTEDRPLDMPNPFQSTDNDEIQQKLLINNCLCGPALMIRRSSLEAAGFWFGEGLDASEDYDICLRLAEVGKMASTSEPLYLYRQHPQSASITQEYKQVVHKAIALERAVRRRWGEEAGQEHYSVVAEDYFWAAILAYSQGDDEGTRQALAKSFAFYPPITAQAEVCERFIRYRMPNSACPALTYIHRLFSDFLPRTPKFSFLESNLISSIHMNEVFAGAKQGERKRVLEHLWPGIHHNPRWLLNTGVLSIAGRFLLGR